MTAEFKVGDLVRYDPGLPEIPDYPALGLVIDVFVSEDPGLYCDSTVVVVNWPDGVDGEDPRHLQKVST